MIPALSLGNKPTNSNGASEKAILYCMVLPYSGLHLNPITMKLNLGSLENLLNSNHVS